MEKRKHKHKLLFFVIIALILTALSTVQTFALSQNTPPGTEVTPSYLTLQSPYLFPNLTIISGEPNNVTTYNFSITDNVNDLKANIWESSERILSYEKYWEVPFLSDANSVMENIISNVDLEKLFRGKQRVMSKIALIDKSNPNLFGLRVSEWIQPNYTAPNYDIWDYSMSTSPDTEYYIPSGDFLTYLCLQYNGSELCVYLAEPTQAECDMALFIAYEEERGYYYVNNANEYFTFSHDDDVNIIGETWEQYFITPETINVNDQLIIQKEYFEETNDTYAYVKNTIIPNESMLYYPEGQTGTTQFRFNITGGNAFIYSYDVSKLNNIALISNIGNYDCKVTYDIRWTKPKDSFLGDGRIQRMWESFHTEEVITNTKYSDSILLFPSSLASKWESYSKPTELYITYYSITIYIRRYDTNASNININIPYRADVANNGLRVFIDEMKNRYAFDLGTTPDGNYTPTDLSEFLNNTVRGIFDAPLFGVISIGTIIMMPIAVVVVLYILKLIAGG